MQRRHEKTEKGYKVIEGRMQGRHEETEEGNKGREKEPKSDRVREIKEVSEECSYGGRE